MYKIIFNVFFGPTISRCESFPHTAPIRPDETTEDGRRKAGGAYQYGEGLTAVHPPSITSVCPVMWRAASLTRNNAADAISCGVAARTIGVIDDHVAA